MLTLEDYHAYKTALLPNRLNQPYLSVQYQPARLGLMSKFGKAADRLRLMLSYNRNINELASLDDKLISDMGINKGDFGMLARQAAICDQIRHVRQRRRRGLNSWSRIQCR